MTNILFLGKICIVFDERLHAGPGIFALDWNVKNWRFEILGHIFDFRHTSRKTHLVLIKKCLCVLKWNGFWSVQSVNITYLTATVSSMISLVSSATSRKVWGSWGDRLPAPYSTRKYRKAIQYSIQCWKKFSKTHPYIEVNSISAEILLLIQKTSSFYKSKCKDTHFFTNLNKLPFSKIVIFLFNDELQNISIIHTKKQVKIFAF